LVTTTSNYFGLFITYFTILSNICRWILHNHIFIFFIQKVCKI